MILVTGGTGLLGSHLLFELVSKGHQVRAIRRASADTRKVRHVFSYYSADPDPLFDRIGWFEADLTDFGAMAEALDGVKEIYHAGAVVSFYPSDHRQMLKVNIDGTANLVNLALERGVGKFCYVSSVATLGRTSGGDPATEETYWNPSGRKTVYSISKYGAEREVWRAMEEGLPAVIVNPSVILGPGFWQDNSGLFRLVHEGLKYYTPGMNGYVDARDLAQIMTGLMERGLFGQRYICSAGNVSYHELFGWMAKYLGKPAPTVEVSPMLGNIAWRVEAVRSRLTRSRPEITREMAHTASQVYTYSSGKVQAALDFRFRPPEESVREICSWSLRDLSRGTR